MTTINSEKGYTLILVMIIISVTVILGLALAGITMNTRTQLNQTENHNKATDLAEMGITYYQTVVRNQVTSAQNAVNTDPTIDFCTKFTELLNQNSIYLPKIVDGNNKYKISPSSISSCSPDLKKIEVHFTSGGFINNGDKPEVELNGVFTIQNNSRVGETAPNQNDFYPTNPNASEKIFYGDYNPQGGNNTITLNNQSWFDSINLNGQDILTVNNDAIFSSIADFIAKLTNKASITVNGDAIFFGTKPDKNNNNKNNKGSICITGNIYTVENGKLVIFNDFNDYFTIDASCQRSNSNTPQWSFDTNTGTTVVYP